MLCTCVRERTCPFPPHSRDPCVCGVCVSTLSPHARFGAGNYGGFFTFWDNICGTDATYRRHLRANADKAVYKNVQ